MSNATLSSHEATKKLNREQLALIPTPNATPTHRPIPHVEIVQTLEKTFQWNGLSVEREEYAVSEDGARMFGVLDLSLEQDGLRFSLGVRNSHNKSMAFGVVGGYRVFVCDNMAFAGDFQPVFRKHTSGINVRGVCERAVRMFFSGKEAAQERLSYQVNREIYDDEAKVIIYDAFTKSDTPKQLLPLVHDMYFENKHPSNDEQIAFSSRTLWSLSNAFTSAFKTLKPIRQFQQTAKFADFIKGY